MKVSARLRILSVEVNEDLRCRRVEVEAGLPVLSVVFVALEVPRVPKFDGTFNQLSDFLIRGLDFPGESRRWAFWGPWAFCPRQNCRKALGRGGP